MPPSDIIAPPVLANPAGCTPAPFLLRSLALLLDGLLAGLLAILILTRLVLPEVVPNWQDIMERLMDAWSAGNSPDLFSDKEFMQLFLYEVQTLFGVFLAYFCISELAWNGQTLGKRVFGLRAARWPMGEPPNWIESVARGILKSASLLDPRLLLANLIPVLFAKSRRSLHDYLARTIVTGDALPAVEESPDDIEE